MGDHPGSPSPEERRPQIRNLLTVDVEEYFHPTEVQESLEQRDWDSMPSRIEEETNAVLEMFRERGVKATFFILGWVASRHPRLVRQIMEAGHEIGCHSYAHQLVYRMTPAQFRQDTQRAVSAIADACGVTPTVYRAPSYSITRDSMWALETLIECGFTHDSSIYPIEHDRYGISGFERHAHTMHTPSGPIHEIPIATVLLPNGRVAPIGGGGYLRLLPYRYTSAGIRRLNGIEQKPACLYFHPWEIDPGQPRLASGVIARLRTYTGMRSMRQKLERLLSDFSFGSLAEVYAELTRPPLTRRAGACQ
jgi:polysaccharide deacetylase family protein (PEP-CTERM system associated)